MYTNKKSVGEVCKITGLNRRQLDEYKDIVKPVSYSTKGHYCRDYERNGRDVRGYESTGHKEYDDEGLDRLILIKLFIELKVKRSEIKRIFQSPDFDFDKSLKEQIENLKRRKEETERLIELAETVDCVGAKNSELINMIVNNYLDPNVFNFEGKELYEGKIDSCMERLENMTSDESCYLDDFLYKLKECKDQGLKYNDEQVLNIMEKTKTLFNEIMLDFKVISLFAMTLLSTDNDCIQCVDEEFGENMAEYLIDVIKYQIMHEVSFEINKVFMDYKKIIEKEEDLLNCDFIKSIHDVFIEYFFNTSKKYFYQNIKTIITDYLIANDDEKAIILKAVDRYCSID